MYFFFGPSETGGNANNAQHLKTKKKNCTQYYTVIRAHSFEKVEQNN